MVHVTDGTGIPLAAHWNSTAEFTRAVAYLGEIETVGRVPKLGWPVPVTVKVTVAMLVTMPSVTEQMYLQFEKKILK